MSSTILAMASSDASPHTPVSGERILANKAELFKWFLVSQIASFFVYSTLQALLDGTALWTKLLVVIGLIFLFLLLWSHIVTGVVYVSTQLTARLNPSNRPGLVQDTKAAIEKPIALFQLAQTSVTPDSTLHQRKQPVATVATQGKANSNSTAVYGMKAYAPQQQQQQPRTFNAAAAASSSSVALVDPYLLV